MSVNFITSINSLNSGIEEMTGWFIVDVDTYNYLRDNILTSGQTDIPMITKVPSKYISGNIFVHEDESLTIKNGVQSSPVDAKRSLVTGLVLNRDYIVEDFMHSYGPYCFVKKTASKVTSFDLLDWDMIKHGWVVTEIFYYEEGKKEIQCLDEGVLVQLEAVVHPEPIVDREIRLFKDCKTLIVEMIPFEGNVNDTVSIKNITLKDETNAIVNPTSYVRADMNYPMISQSYYDADNGILLASSNAAPENAIGWKVTDLARRVVRIAYVFDTPIDISKISVTASMEEGQMPEHINVYGSAIDTRVLGIIDFVREPFVTQMGYRQFLSPSELLPGETVSLSLGSDQEPLPKYRTSEYRLSPVINEMPQNTSGGQMVALGHLGYAEGGVQIAGVAYTASEVEGDSTRQRKRVNFRFVDPITMETVVNGQHEWYPKSYPLDETGGLTEHTGSNLIPAGSTVYISEAWNFRVPPLDPLDPSGPTEDRYLAMEFTTDDVPVEGVAHSVTSAFVGLNGHLASTHYLNAPQFNKFASYELADTYLGSPHATIIYRETKSIPEIN